MFGSGEIIVVVAVIMMLFGSSQIPKLAKNLGLAQKELKDALSDNEPKPEPPAARTDDTRLGATENAPTREGAATES